MARVTRSKKIEIAEDHTALASQTPLPDTPSQQTQPLTEVHNSMGADIAAMGDNTIATDIKGLKAAYKAALGIGIGKKAKKSKAKKGKQDQESEDTITEQFISAGDSPVPEATRLLLQSREEHATINKEQQIVPAPRITRRQLAQAQAAEEALAKQGAVAQDTKNQIEAVVLTVPAEITSDSGDSATEQATVVSQATPSPSRSPVRTLAEVEEVYRRVDSPAPAYDAGEDSFVQQITGRSPAKPVSRIEDSVEALDQLEEALDALDQAALAERIVSPEKKRFPRPHLNEKAIMDKKTLATKAQPPKSGATTMRLKATAPRPSVLKKATSMTFKPSPTELSRSSSVQLKAQPKAKAPVKRPLSLMPPKETAKSTKPPTRPTFELPGEAVARKLKEQKEARLAQRETNEDSFHTARVVSGPKIKSTKLPTYPTFELPGEAVSRKKREAHEARLKAQEEEDRKRREFKARPIRNSIVPDFVPRDTVASRARQSRIGLENMGVDDISVSKRGSNVGAHRPSILELSKANMSAPRAKAAPPVRKPTPTTHGPSMSGRAMQRTLSTTDVQVQRQRARDIYNRDAKLAEDLEREKRDREAAAKRAREEAAERGRQASREWAEKQMARKMAEGDKGMSAGYGPGGQMGLKS
ncbi:uncharacterized protein LY89DRAFT_684267 [Mollisia scopiformis]|uniref:TPX2 C-terminal domain-containing protein n=1 Tax=Mollisia scopiformis TaxID=149040 RepID=A0A194XF07_MOLSC|nr:uncharacterized protein LY89DRAFT_684267 [Mollisia scopiformis]KUJ18352.1 hypothetical protein LY89DRAFT_684267 [Mollisia scopiformis]